MEKSKFTTPSEIAQELGVSKSYAYKVVRQLNEQLREQGFMVILGKVIRVYYEERFYGMKEET